MLARAALREALQQMASALRPLLAEATIPLPPTEDYDVVRADLVNRLGDAFLGYVSTTRGAADKNEARRAVTADVPAAFYRGLRDAGAEDVDAEDAAWMAKKQAEQLAYLNNAFDDLKAMRKAETATESGLRARAEMWGKTLDGIYSEGKLRGSKGQTLIFGGEDGVEQCDTCRKLKGKKRTIKWIIANDMIPRPGNTNFSCGGWNCRHAWFTKDGEQFTF